MLYRLYCLYCLYDRDVVLDWFIARRDMDGLPHNPRQAKQARTSHAAQQPKQQQQHIGSSPQLDKAAAVQARGAAGAAPAVSRLTAKELASLRSALPSPLKHKGQKLAEELGIKAGETKATSLIKALTV